MIASACSGAALHRLYVAVATERRSSALVAAAGTTYALPGRDGGASTANAQREAAAVTAHGFLGLRGAVARVSDILQVAAGWLLAAWLEWAICYAPPFKKRENEEWKPSILNQPLSNAKPLTYQVDDFVPGCLLCLQQGQERRGTQEDLHSASPASAPAMQK